MARIHVKTARWNAAVAPGQKEWHERGVQTIVIGPDNPPPPVSEKLFAGHIPNHVFVGMATPESNKWEPTFDTAKSILNHDIYERRIFSPNAVAASSLSGMLQDCDRFNAYPVVSFKQPFGDFSSGNFNAKLDIIVNEAISRRQKGQREFSVGNHHEPVAGDKGKRNLGTLRTWARDNMYTIRYMAGWRNHASNPDTGGVRTGPDVTDMVAWHAIHNGFIWGPKNREDNCIDAGYPTGLSNGPGGWGATSPNLVQVFKQYSGLLMADFYDANPPHYENAKDVWLKNKTAANMLPMLAQLDNPTGYTNADRTSMKMTSFITWARQKGCGAIGCGEFSTTTAAEMQNVMNVVFANRDIWGVCNYFNSGNSSRHEWRLLPDTYGGNWPAYTQANGANPPNVEGVPDNGGNKQTGLRLALMRTFLDQSVTTYN